MIACSKLSKRAERGALDNQPDGQLTSPRLVVFGCRYVCFTHQPLMHSRPKHEVQQVELMAEGQQWLGCGLAGPAACG